MGALIRRSLVHSEFVVLLHLGVYFAPMPFLCTHLVYNIAVESDLGGNCVPAAEWGRPGVISISFIRVIFPSFLLSSGPLIHKTLHIYELGVQTGLPQVLESH